MNSVKSSLLWSDRGILIPLLLIGLAASVLAAGVVWRARDALALSAAIEQREQLMALANELRNSSDALTRWSRAYVITGEPRYRTLYEELMEVRNGQRARPASHTPIYWNLREFTGAPRDESGPTRAFLALLADAGANPDELMLLESARDASDRLAILERQVMDERAAVPGAASEAQAATLFDAHYIALKSEVVQPIENFARRVSARTQDSITALESSTLSADRLIVAMFLLMLAGLAAVWFAFRRLAGDSFGGLVARIRALAPGAKQHAENGTGESLATQLQTIAHELDVRGSSIRKLISDLQTERAHLQQLIAQAPVAIALFDREMRYVAFSQRWIAAYGLQGRELIGHSHYDIFPEIPARWREIHRRGLAGENLSAQEDCFERADGTAQYLRWEVAPWFGSAGSIDGIVILSEDITANVTQRRQLEGWTQAYEQSRVGAAIIDPTEDGLPRIVDVNPQMARLLGYTREELCGQAVMTLVPEELQEPMRATIPELESTGHVSFESELLTKDGRRIPVLLDITNRSDTADGRRRRTVFAIELSERNRLMGELAHTIEDLRASNQRLREARDEAAAASSTRNAILSNISHELRTPLNHVMGFAALLEHAGLDAKATERLRRISAAGSALSRLVNNLLDAVRLETDTLSIHASDVELSGLIAELQRDMGPACKAARIALHTTVAADLPTRIRADRRLIVRALRELLDNAVKFSGGRDIALQLSRQADAIGPRLLCTVTDHGIGISPAQQQRLFAWFTQGDDSHTREHGGVGMGLVLAQRIVALMSGTIGYRATPGGGSTFTIELPLEAAQSPPVAETVVSDPAAACRWLQSLLATLRSADMQAARAWTGRPASVDPLLGDRAVLVGTAVTNFDFDVAAELVADALEAEGALPLASGAA